MGGAWLGFPGDISAAPRSARTFEAIEKFSLKPISWPFPGGQDLKRDKLALDCRVQEVGEGMKDLGFSGLDCLKEKDLLRVGEEIYAIRQYSLLSTSFPLNKVNDELRPPARRAYASERTFGPRMIMKPFGFLILSFLTVRVILMMNVETFLRRMVIRVS